MSKYNAAFLKKSKYYFFNQILVLKIADKYFNSLNNLLNIRFLFKKKKIFKK